MTKFDIRGLRSRKAELVTKLNAMVATAENEDREFTDQEKETEAKLQAEIVTLNDRIDRVEKAMDREREVSAEDRTIATREKATQDGEKFPSFGAFMKAVYDAGRTHGRVVDPRLIGAATGLNESVPSEGGFAVPQEFEPGILTMMNNMGDILSRVRRRPITVGNGVKFNAVDEQSRATGSRWGGVQAYWINEAGTPTPSKPKFKRIDIRLEKVAALYYATEEELEDAEGLSSVLEQAFAEELTFMVEDGIVRGDGVGKPLGILNSPALVTVNKETSQAAATLKTQNVLKMWARLPARSQKNAAWLINVDVLPQLFQFVYEVKNVAGSENVGGIAAPIYNPDSNTLLSRPVIPVEYCETLGTAGDIILADLSQYLLADKGGVRSSSSIHVNFTAGEQVFRVIYRVNGQPIWNKALTPYKGSNTLSPFVNLQTR